jgi:hypothetical protein
MSICGEKESGTGFWSVEGMKTYMESELEAKINIRGVENRCNLRKSSLQDRISNTRKGSRVKIPPKSGTFERTFTIEYNEFADYIKNLDARLMPLTLQEFLNLAFSLAEELKIPHTFYNAKGMAD